ncbi:hypothetical protein JOC75_000686 [Metabacillus crassostreae]|uniref:hypothetical protein n=1 Tax=Metabacillus crassostreae TaxID=929098 RepID=UPI00195C1926|nr:hypothetical protein [Metabacillus crassostreae]MBM7602716.1 hypothetical protein [Metabacillus crassostreae]
MRKVIFGVLLLLLVLTGYSILNKVHHNVELEKSIYSIVEDINNTEIRIKTLANFDWDKGFLFKPYSSQKLIDEQLNVHFRDPSNIDWRDDIYLLVFMKENEVVQYAEIDRQGADFKLSEKEYLTPSDDVVIIERY